MEPDWELVANKTGAPRLGFSVMLKFFEIDGRFPEYGAEVPEQAVTYLAEQVRVDPALFAKYEFSSRTAKYHRPHIRQELGFREYMPRLRARWTAASSSRTSNSAWTPR